MALDLATLLAIANRARLARLESIEAAARLEEAFEFLRRAREIRYALDPEHVQKLAQEAQLGGHDAA